MDTGCYADGALGHDHCRKVLAGLVEHLVGDYANGHSHGELEFLADSLRGPMPDDAWDEYEALNLLNDATPDDRIWLFWDGDLMLMPIDYYED
jgi:hypothetical protein